MSSIFGLFPVLSVLPPFHALLSECSASLSSGGAVVVLLPLESPHADGESKLMNIPWSEGGTETGQGLLSSQQRGKHTCPGDTCNISKCLSGLFPPLSIPVSWQHVPMFCSADHDSLWSPRHSGFSFGLSENASCFSLHLFPGLDLQQERWDVFPAHPLCLGSALFKCTACSTKTHYQTSPSTVAWLCHCSRRTATANVQNSLSGL